jgi:hypothetical protein
VSDYRIKPGVSTRVAQLATGERFIFAREALDKAAEQAGSRFIPIRVEHLSYLPPRGRITRAEIETAPDGESELVLHGTDLTALRAADMSLMPTTATSDEPTDTLDDITLTIEPRNFTPEAWQRITSQAPVPITEAAAWAALPPLIVALAIPVTWGAVRFAGSFMSRLGEVAADDFYSWIRRTVRSARQPDREALVEIRFDIKDGGPAVIGITAFDGTSDASIADLRKAIDSAGLLAEFAGSVAAGQQPAELRQCAFQWDSDRWRLAWWATDDAVYITPWLRQNYPDPQRFLGRPLPPPDSNHDGG